MSAVDERRMLSTARTLMMLSVFFMGVTYETYLYEGDVSALVELLGVYSLYLFGMGYLYQLHRRHLMAWLAILQVMILMTMLGLQLIHIVSFPVVLYMMEIVLFVMFLQKRQQIPFQPGTIVCPSCERGTQPPDNFCRFCGAARI